MPTNCSRSPSGSVRRARAAHRSTRCTSARRADQRPDGVILREGEQVARLLDLPWEEDDPGHWGPRCGRAGTRDARRRLAADNVAEAIRRVRPWAVDAASRLRVGPGDQGSREGARTSRRRGRDRGRTAWRPRTLDADPGARRAHCRLGGRARGRGLPRGARRARTHLRRPPDAADARRAVRARQAPLPQARICSTRARTSSTTRSARRCSRRLGKQRIVAETGAGQHGVATATVCARFGLDCVVYMGAEDMRRQKPNVERMGSSAPRCDRSSSGRGR